MLPHDVTCADVAVNIGLVTIKQRHLIGSKCERVLGLLIIFYPLVARAGCFSGGFFFFSYLKRHDRDANCDVIYQYQYLSLLTEIPTKSFQSLLDAKLLTHYKISVYEPPGSRRTPEFHFTSSNFLPPRKQEYVPVSSLVRLMTVSVKILLLLALNWNFFWSTLAPWDCRLARLLLPRYCTSLRPEMKRYQETESQTKVPQWHSME